MQFKRINFSVQTQLYFLIFSAVLLHLSGLFVTILGPDANLYASIAKNMVVRNDYLQLFGDGKEWLDKPHFPFWITALFFRIFGVATWSYKLPAILFTFGAAGYTFLFARSLYSREVALWAVAILLTAEHIALSDSDVRAEPYLTALIIGALYHFTRSMDRKQWVHLLLGALLTACALMTKGMMALFPIGGAIAGELIIKKRWKDLFHIRWLVAGILVFIFITPELYSLYYQFDAHPEKVVFGHTQVSGIRFFFWDSQFGRFFNTGPIKGKGDPFFFVHTLLWAFLPWSLVLFAAIYRFFRRSLRNRAGYEWYCISGSLITFLLFSASSFQLPHYLNIVFPFFAIITASYLLSLHDAATIRRVQGLQTVIIVLMWIAQTTLSYTFHLYPENPFAGIFSLLLLQIAVYSAYVFFHRRGLPGTLIRTGLASVTINIFLNLGFFTELARYQSGSEAAFWINGQNKAREPVAQLIHEQYAFALDFYLDQPLYNLDTVHNHYPPTPFLLYLHPSGKAALLKKGWQMDSLQTFEHYPVSRLKLNFLKKSTRSSTLTTYEVVRVNRY